MKKTAIWGAGGFGTHFTLAIGKENFDFFIDKNKKGKWLGKEIINPASISDWGNLFVYIPFNFYDEISKFLESKGLVEGKDFASYSNILYLKPKFKEDYDRAVREIKLLDKEKCKLQLAFWSGGWFTIPAYTNYLWRMKHQGIDVLIVSEASWLDREETIKMMGMDAVVLPSYIADFAFIKEDDLSWDMDCSFNEDEQSIIKTMADSMLAANFGITYQEALHKSMFYYHFVNEFLSQYRFKAILTIGSESIENQMLKRIAEKHHIPVMFTHQGILPGTFAISAGGDLGSSYPSMYSEKFRRLSITDADLDHAKNVLEYLFQSRANRKIQPQNNWKRLCDGKYVEGRPTVLYAAQNDRETSIFPYTEETKKYHSPTFHTSVESGIYIAEICKRNNWNFIYKPHPLYVREDEKNMLPDYTIYIDQGDINEMIDFSDVVVTIASSVNYVALIRRKPVLMLGYNQTRGQGCTYEAFCKNKIESELMFAISSGFTEEQQRNFIKHVARLLKYYLYDDMMERELRYGLSMPYSVEEFFITDACLKAEEENK